MKLPATIPDLPGWAWAGLGLAAAWFLLRPRDAASTAAKFLVDTTGGVVEGTVKGIGAAVGIPDTDAANCQASLDAGDEWSASFYCPAGTFLKSLVTPQAKTTTPSRVLTPKEKQWDYQPFDMTCIAGICGPSYESQSNGWSLDLWINEKNSQNRTITPVAGLRG